MLKKLDKNTGVPQFIKYGTDLKTKYKYFAIELLGPTL